MKKSLVIGIVGLAASIVSSLGQGTISLNNYNTSITSLSPTHPLQDVKFNGVPISTSTTGGPYTAALEYVNVAGNYVADFAADTTGQSVPSFLYSGPGVLTLSSVTGGIDNSDTGTAGEYAPKSSINPGLGAGATVTCMVIAYDGSSYNTAEFRGHSTAFTMTTSVGTAFPEITGVAENDGGFDVATPEPSAFALSGLGAAALMLFRRKK